MEQINVQDARTQRSKLLVRDMAKWIGEAGFRPLAITVEHRQKAGARPRPRRARFDRWLAAQSALEGWPLVSRDRALRRFGVAAIW